MYYRYTAFLWNALSETESVAAKMLMTAFREAHPLSVGRSLGPGGIAYDQPDPSAVVRAYPIYNHSGVIYGRLFSRGGMVSASPDELASDCIFAHACIDSNGDHLTRNFWGCYVAILRMPFSGQWRIVRDCSGMIPCYYAQFRGVTVIFSDVRTLEGLPLSLEVNWKYVAAFLSWPHLQIRETGLLGITEVLAGESLTIAPARLRTEFQWNPMALAANCSDVDPINAAAELRATTQACISAWASLFRGVAHCLSGGLDSSIVLACLQRAPRRPAVTCVNRFADGAAEDERSFARLSAVRAGAALIEVPWDEAARVFDEHCFTADLAVKPSTPYLSQILQAPTWRNLCMTHGCQAIWTGQGGDHLFGAFRTDLAPIDCLFGGSHLRQFPAALLDAAYLTRHSVWHVLASGIRAAIRRRDFERAVHLEPRRYFMRPEAGPKNLIEYLAHPWYAASRSLPPGKRYHLLELANVLNRQRPVLGLEMSDQFHPLLSQPLIELCLRYPLHLLLHGGRTRGLARLAFADDVPREILSRELKGQTATYSLGVVRRSHRFLADTLREGVLVRQQLLSPASLTAVLEADEPMRAEMFFPLFACLAAEVWVRSWQRRRTRRDGYRLCTASALVNGTDTTDSGALTAATT